VSNVLPVLPLRAVLLLPLLLLLLLLTATATTAPVATTTATAATSITTPIATCVHAQHRSASAQHQHSCKPWHAGLCRIKQPDQMLRLQQHCCN
jgi:hypothetical protein